MLHPESSFHAFEYLARTNKTVGWLVGWSVGRLVGCPSGRWLMMSTCFSSRMHQQHPTSPSDCPSEAIFNKKQLMTHDGFSGSHLPPLRFSPSISRAFLTDPLHWVHHCKASHFGEGYGTHLGSFLKMM